VTAFDDWLTWLKSARKGPVPLYADRGRDFSACITLDADFSGSSLRGQVRLLPDEGPVQLLGDFTIGAATIDENGNTLFAVSMPGALIAAMPLPVPGDGHGDFAYDLLLTDSGGHVELLFGGAFSVGGRVTR
jgi:hypothetical protein